MMDAPQRSALQVAQAPRGTLQDHVYRQLCELILNGEIAPGNIAQLEATIRRSEAVSESLADGSTVMDYCPEADICSDFLRLADWLRGVAPAHRDGNS